MSKNNAFSLKARLMSFSFAIKGLRYLAVYEHNFRVHMVVAFSVISLGVCLQVTRFEWLWLIMAIASVMSAEAMNTAIERACDAVIPEHNQLIGVAKDVAAGAVFINACACALIGVIIFLPYIVLIFI